MSIAGECTAVIRTPSHAHNAGRVASKHVQAVPGFEIPQPQRLIRGSGESVTVVGAKRHAQDLASVASEHAQAAPGLQVPHPHGAVVGAQVSRKFRLLAGWRHFKVDYDKGDFLYDAAQSGPIVGLRYTF
jgi:hypothetical protein